MAHLDLEQIKTIHICTDRLLAVENFSKISRRSLIKTIFGNDSRKFRLFETYSSDEGASFIYGYNKYKIFIEFLYFYGKISEISILKDEHKNEGSIIIKMCGPSIVLFDYKERIAKIQYIYAGNYHRINGPAFIEFVYDLKLPRVNTRIKGRYIVREEYYIHGKLHNRKGLACVDKIDKNASAFYITDKNIDKHTFFSSYLTEL